MIRVDTSVGKSWLGINFVSSTVYFIKWWLPLQVQEHSPGFKAGLEAFFDFIVCIGNTRLVRSLII